MKTRGEKVCDFIEQYCLAPEGSHVGKPIVLEPFQRKFILDIYDNPAGTHTAYLSIARKNGKALSLDTRLPTPSGWTTMGEVREGDTLFDESGSPCKVTFATEVQHGRKCYWVKFADGAKILADADHQWTVRSRRLHGKQITITTKEMVGEVVLPWSRDGRAERNFSVVVAGAIKLPDADLPIPPYTLGAWLGDGSSSKAEIYIHDDDINIIENIKSDGFPAKKSVAPFCWSISDGVKDRTKDCLKSQLRRFGLINNKHIPTKWLRGSERQRLDLLQGLMDTDGHVTKSGQCEFVGVNERLCRDVLELIRSLGMKATWKEDRATLRGVDCGPRYRVQFWGTPDKPPFRLKRKLDRIRSIKRNSRNSSNYIVAVEEAESVPVRCIQVDSPSSLFLAGDAFTPTHNTALIAGIMLAHLVGPEAKQNSQIVSGARSREQAAQVFNYASKMVMLSETLSRIVRIIPSSKRMVGLLRNVEYRALSAEGKTAHGLSPVLAILDEVGQVRGPQDDFIDAITTAQGAHDDPLLIAISTQAANDGDLFSIWLDDAANSKDPQIVSHVYAAKPGASLLDREAWRDANPALGKFRSLADLEKEAKKAARMPSSENTFRNLCLNQRVSTVSPFISRDVWTRCGGAVLDFGNCEVFGGLDLSARTDLTALVLIGKIAGVWHVVPHFWTPEDGLIDRAKRDRAPYDLWVRQGYMHTTPGATVDYEYVAQDIAAICSELNVRSIAYDRWRIDLLKKELETIGLDLPLVPFGQGFKDMSPAIDALEAEILNERLAHGAHPVLTMCASNAVISSDPAGNRKLDKHKANGRIDGMVALAMAFGAAQGTEKDDADAFDSFLRQPLRVT